jgi:hypothetical protein
VRARVEFSKRNFWKKIIGWGIAQIIRLERYGQILPKLMSLNSHFVLDDVHISDIRVGKILVQLTNF